jgi:hypothetical protein
MTDRLKGDYQRLGHGTPAGTEFRVLIVDSIVLATIDLMIWRHAAS